MILSRTPLRIALAGGGTDQAHYYTMSPPGVVVSMAVSLYIEVVLKARYDRDLIAVYSKRERVAEGGILEHELFRESLALTGIRGGIEIHTLADVASKGSGLGSSSSVTVGTLNALYAYLGIPQPPEVLADQACSIEIERCAKPIGKQDQYIAAYGGLRCILFTPNRITVSDPLLTGPDLRSLSDRLLLFYMGQGHSASDILCSCNAAATQDMRPLDRLKTIAWEMESAIKAKRWDTVGHLLDESWGVKKGITGISTPEADHAYACAKDAGALGGKLCGAGGGGHMVLYVSPVHQDDVREAMSGFQEVPFRPDPYGSRILLHAD